MTTHLVTGATGLVGGALVLELLAETDDRVLALARPGDTSADERLHSSLRTAATAYGLDASSLPLHRVQALPGDITAEGCGVPDRSVQADVLWHSAASLRYEDRYEADIRRTNVDGTRNVLELARRSGVRVANMISTAYVAGRKQGRVAEVPQDGTQVHNHYERSKVDAEALSRSIDDIEVRVLRPSIVVGHSQTLAVTTFSGLYGFARQMVQYRGVLERMQAGLYRERPLKLRAHRDTPLDFVTVDEVAAQAVAIGNSSTASGIYHLTRPDCPTAEEVLTAVSLAVGFPPPEFVNDDEELDWLDAQFDKRLDFYGSYLRGNKVFDRSRADAALGGRRELHRALPPVRDMVDWYIDRLAVERQSVPVAR